ncbi:hypothetical protein GCM10010528_04550 [Gordonia defluvii]|uniref:Uncharacterized protein n=1 Tax=Gordonia defluvii TaxID=283718 RepID=A0ABN3YEE0_9ACTN
MANVLDADPGRAKEVRRIPAEFGNQFRELDQGGGADQMHVLQSQGDVPPSQDCWASTGVDSTANAFATNYFPTTPKGIP